MSAFSLSASSSVYVGGSRSLVPSAPAGVALARFVGSLGSRPIRVGCASGADALALASAPVPSVLSVFAQFSSSGAGAFGSSAVSAVFSARARGASVSFLAGGSLSVPVRARLIRRSVAGFSGAGVAVFFAPGSGSLAVARRALAASVPVLVWAGGSAPSLPGFVPSRVSFCGLSFWFFSPAQAPLF